MDLIHFKNLKPKKKDGDMVDGVVVAVGVNEEVDGVVVAVGANEEVDGVVVVVGENADGEDQLKNKKVF